MIRLADVYNRKYIFDVWKKALETKTITGSYYTLVMFLKNWV